MGATANDYQALESVRIPVRVEVMYTYLCDQRGYNMQEVAELVLGDRQEQAGKRVSSIMRCYGFSGNNSRRYRNRALKQDIEDFVRSYPRGAGEGEFDRFLNQRLQQRKQMADNQKKQEQEARKRLLAQQEKERKSALELQIQKEQLRLQEEERQRKLQEEALLRQQEYEKKQAILRAQREHFLENHKKAQALAKQGSSRAPEAVSLYQALIKEFRELDCYITGVTEDDLLDEYGSVLFRWGLDETNPKRKIQIYSKVPRFCSSHAAASNNIGVIYNNPDFGGYDIVLAAQWFEEAAVFGSSRGAKNLADLLADQDPKRALRYYKQSCADPKIALQVKDIIEQLTKQLKDGELTGVSQFLRQHPEWFQVSAGSYPDWRAYAAAHRLPLDKLWRKYQETNSHVYERQRFLIFTKKEYRYLGDLELNDFLNACQEEWERRLTVYGTEGYICAPVELARVMDCHSRGMQRYNGGDYEAAARELGLCASCGKPEDKRVLFDIYARHLNLESKAIPIAKSLAEYNGDLDAYAYLLRVYLKKSEKDASHLWQAARLLQRGGQALKEKEASLCQTVEDACEQQAKASAHQAPEQACELLELIGRTQGDAMGLALFQRGRMAEADEDEELKNLEAALGFFEQAANLGNKDAARRLADYYLSTPCCVESGLEILEKLAAEKDEGSAVKLGEIYYLGNLVEKDNQRAVSYFELCEDPLRFPQYADAAFSLAYEASNAEDYETALKYYTVAAHAGDAGAQNNLGVMYMKGRGVPKDEEEGAKWYRLAADKGNGLAAANLGRYLYRKNRLEEAKKYLKKAQDLGRDVAETLEKVSEKQERQYRLKVYKDSFQEEFDRGDYASALIILEELHVDFPNDPFYDTMLIPCLEEGGEEMEENKKHEELAKHYGCKGHMDLAWEHYKLARQLEQDADLLLFLFDEENTTRPEGDLDTWRLDFIEFWKDLDEADYSVCQSAFSQCCTLEQLAAEDNFGNPDYTKWLANYRRYTELKIEIAWKFKQYEECAKWLAERYTVKGSGYDCPIETGILANIGDQKTRNRLILYSDAWEAYEGFLEQNQITDPDEELILQEYLSSKFSEHYVFSHNYLGTTGSVAQLTTLAALTALTKNKSILEKLFRCYLEENEGNGGDTSANQFVGDALLTVFQYNMPAAHRRHLSYYLSGQRPPHLSDWLTGGLWMETYQNGIEDFRSDLRNGVSAHWGKTLDDDAVWQTLDRPENHHILEALEEMLSQETALCLKEKRYPCAAAILQMLNLGSWGQRFRKLQETLSDALEGTQWYHEINDAIKGGDLWEHRDDPTSAKKAVAYFERYINARQAALESGSEKVTIDFLDVTGFENNGFEETTDDFFDDNDFEMPFKAEDWEAERLRSECYRWDEQSLYCLIQAYLKGEGAAQDFAKVKEYCQMYMDWGFGSQRSMLWMEFSEILERSGQAQAGGQDIRPADITDTRRANTTADAPETKRAGRPAKAPETKQSGSPAKASNASPANAPDTKSADLTANAPNTRPLLSGLRKGEKPLALCVDGEDSRTAAGVKSFTAAMKWVLERECAGNPEGRTKLEQILSLRDGKKLPGGLPVRFFSPMLPEEEQKNYTIPSASIKQIEGTNLVLLFHYSSDTLCEILINLLKYMGADLDRFQLVLDSE